MNDEKLITSLYNKGIYLPVPNVKPVQNDITGRLVELEEDYYGCFYGIHIFIEKGFVYDGGSKPEFSWGLIGSAHTGYDKIPCFIHDVLYGCMGQGKPLTIKTLKHFDINHSPCPPWVHDNFYNLDFFSGKLTDTRFKRNEADWKWLELMDDFSVCWSKRNAMYSMVRTFGNSAWHDSTMVDIEKDRKLITITKEFNTAIK
jgi:hypothetical protein